MGHSSIQTTVDIYGHKLKEQNREAARIDPGDFWWELKIFGQAIRKLGKAPRFLCV